MAPAWLNCKRISWRVELHTNVYQSLIISPANLSPHCFNRQLLGDRDGALVGSFLADHHPEERCLSRAVGTDQPDFFARIQLKRSVHEEQLLAILLIDVGEGDHCEGVGRGTVPLLV